MDKRGVSYLMCRARCSLRVKLNLQGGKSVQKNRCPFFFFDTRPVSGSMVSISEAASPSPSDSSMSISCEIFDEKDCCDCPREMSVSGLCGDENELRNGEVGRGRWPLMPPKLSLVGVFGADSVNA